MAAWSARRVRTVSSSALKGRAVRRMTKSTPATFSSMRIGTAISATNLSASATSRKSGGMSGSSR